MTALGLVAPQYRTPSRPAAGDVCRTVKTPRGAALAAAGDRYARLARGCKPRGCRAPARRVHGRRVRYVIGSEPGQVNGMRWRGVRAREGR